VVIAPNYECAVPNSISLARQFLQRTTPAHFFRVVAPLAQVLTLLSVIAAWEQPARWTFAIALGVLIVADVITFTFHYPRLAIMFNSPVPQDSDELRRAAREWAMGNWVRGVLLVVALLILLRGLIQLATRFPA
jgi:hypothetical protein